jgi:hypothetical protein
LLRREDGLDLITRLLMDRSDLGLLVFSQTKATQWIATAAPARTTGTARTTEATLTSAARPAAAHRTLGRALTTASRLNARTLVVHASRWTTLDRRTPDALFATGTWGLLALRLRRRDSAPDGDDGDANYGKYAFHS